MAVFSDSKVVNENGRIIYKSGLEDLHSADKKLYKTDYGLRKEIIQNWSIPGSTIMVRRSLHKKIRYNEKLVVEDRDFYLKLVAENLLGFINNTNSAYRLHGENFCFDKKNRYISSVNKFKSLIFNISRFTLKDRFLFVIPIISSFLGILVYGMLNKIKKSGDYKKL